MQSHPSSVVPLIRIPRTFLDQSRYTYLQGELLFHGPGAYVFETTFVQVPGLVISPPFPLTLLAGMVQSDKPHQLVIQVAGTVLALVAFQIKLVAVTVEVDTTVQFELSLNFQLLNDHV